MSKNFLGETSHTPQTACTNCGRIVDSATGVSTNNQPNPGDAAVCVGCGHIMAYAEDRTLRELTDDEIKEVAGNPEILLLQRALGAAKHIKGKIHNVVDRRCGCIGSWEIEPLDYARLSDADIGRTVIYRDHGRAEAGTLTSWRDGTVFARYTSGDTAAGANSAHLVFGIARADDAGESK